MFQYLSYKKEKIQLKTTDKGYKFERIDRQFKGEDRARKLMLDQRIELKEVEVGMKYNKLY